jgi:hypothetical protein
LLKPIVQRLNKRATQTRPFGAQSD